MILSPINTNVCSYAIDCDLASPPGSLYQLKLKIKGVLWRGVFPSTIKCSCRAISATSENTRHINS